MNGTDTNPAHWWRTLLAGLVAVAIGGFDLYHFGRDAGLSVELDELLIIGGVGLIAGVPRILWSLRGNGSTSAATAPPEPEPPAAGEPVSTHEGGSKT